MIRQSFKDLYLEIVRFASLPAGLGARLRFARPKDAAGHALHLGCGEHYIDGMINIDGNIRRKKDLWWDLRNRLPFADGTAAFVYCCHTLEHFYPHDALRLLREMRRVLRPDGVCRIAVPSMEYALKIAQGSAKSDWPRRFDDRLAQAVNYLFCDGQHKYGYSFALLADFAAQSGFTRIEQRQAAEGGVQYGRVTVPDEPQGSLVAELRA